MKRMAKFWLILMSIFMLVEANGQTSKIKNAFSYKFVITDYLTLDPVHQAAYDTVTRILNPDDWNFAAEIGYFRNINKHLNVGLALRVGSIDANHLVYSPTDTACQPCEQRKKRELFFGGDIVAQYKFTNDLMLKEDFFLSPYIFVGIGGRYLNEREGNFDVQLPVGLGLNIRLNPNFYIQAQMEYRKSFLTTKDGIEISGGLLWLIDFKKKNKTKTDEN